MHIFETQFLYVLLKEIEYRPDDNGRSHSRIDMRLRVVYWSDDSDPNGGYFVLYGSRPKSNISGEYKPFRILCRDIDTVLHFAKTVTSADHSIQIELQQFSALNDDSEDELNVSWENNAEDRSTEIVAYDFDPQLNADGIQFVPFDSCMKTFLQVLKRTETI